MSDVHYFQRYSTKENAVTNSTLLLFGRIYEHSPQRLRILLNEMLDDDLQIGVNFTQQVRGEDSVPDASIQQAPFKIVIETKVDAGVSITQLQSHIRGLGTGDNRHLLLLTRDPVSEATLQPALADAAATHISFIHRTFEELCKYLGDKVEPHEIYLKPVVDDFISYCEEMKLLPDRRVWLRVVPCGKSHALNRQYGIYFHPTDRPYNGHGLLGIYWGKSVRLVGEVRSVYDVALIGGALTKTFVNGVATDEFDHSIRAMIADTLPATGWNISTGHRFYCTSGFVETNYVKSSPYGIQGSRKLDITTLYPPGTTLATLATALGNNTWL